MSRTDKDKPYWVQATWWEPFHDRDCVDFIPNSWLITAYNRGSRSRPCNLSPNPLVRRYHSFHGRRLSGCYWVPFWDADLKQRFPHCPPAPKWFRDHVWNNTSRRQVRDTCRQAGKEFRATGEVDIIPPVDQHRHCAWWLWS